MPPFADGQSAARKPAVLAGTRHGPLGAPQLRLPSLRLRHALPADRSHPQPLPNLARDRLRLGRASSGRRSHPDVGFIGCEPFINNGAEPARQDRGWRSSPPSASMTATPGTCSLGYQTTPSAASSCCSQTPGQRSHQRRRLISSETIEQVARAEKPAANSDLPATMATTSAGGFSPSSRMAALAWTAERVQGLAAPFGLAGNPLRSLERRRLNRRPPLTFRDS